MSIYKQSEMIYNVNTKHIFISQGICTIWRSHYISGIYAFKKYILIISKEERNDRSNILITESHW